MPELRLENVSYQYKNGDRKVVNHVTCRFEGGKLNAIIGSSGSGKTTLLSLMAGLDQPTHGRIYIDGELLAGLDLDQYRRERVSMIFQAFQLFPLLTALENVCFPMQLNGVLREEIQARGKRLLASVGIAEEKFHRYPANLSGGEQQRVAIARTLATGAHVLLADEPTGNWIRPTARTSSISLGSWRTNRAIVSSSSHIIPRSQGVPTGSGICPMVSW